MTPAGPCGNFRQLGVNGLADGVPLKGREGVLKIDIDHAHGRTMFAQCLFQQSAEVDQRLSASRDCDTKLAQ